MVSYNLCVVATKIFPISDFTGVNFDNIVKGGAGDRVIFINKKGETLVDYFCNFKLDSLFGSESKFFLARFGNNNKISFVVNKFYVAGVSVRIFDAEFFGSFAGEIFNESIREWLRSERGVDAWQVLAYKKNFRRSFEELFVVFRKIIHNDNRFWFLKSPHETEDTNSRTECKDNQYNRNERKLFLILLRG